MGSFVILCLDFVSYIFLFTLLRSGLGYFVIQNLLDLTYKCTGSSVDFKILLILLLWILMCWIWMDSR